MTGPVATRMVLWPTRQIDVAVLEIARGGLLRAGMGVRYVNVGAVLNVSSDHLGMKGIDTLEELAEVKRIRRRGGARLRGAQCRRSALPQDGRVHRGEASLLRDDEPAHALVREHIRAGGRACALEPASTGR
jgi:cyanophycin synthetase